jgi:thiamine-phosphate pyrophosphorylase
MTAVPPLHAVTDDEVAARPDFLDRAAEVMAAGGRMLALHLRAPHASGRGVHELAVRLMDSARSAGALLVINDRLDVAMAVGADGIQLGRRGLPLADAYRLVGGRMHIGASVHALADAKDAFAAGADWVLAGAIYPTPSHPGESPAGIRLIEDAASAGLPVIAIGGVTAERVAEVRSAGAAGVAAIRGIWDDPSPAAAVKRYIEAWQS